MIGNTIRAARIEKNISLSELARRTGISKSYISMVENGQYENPSLSILKKLALALEISFDENINQYSNVEEEWIELAHLASKSGITKDEFIKFIHKKAEEKRGK